MESEILAFEIEKVVKFIHLKLSELENKGNHYDDLALLIPEWLYNAIQRYYHVFFKSDLPEMFFTLKPFFHYKDEVVVYNFRYPEKNFYLMEFGVRIVENRKQIFIIK